ncbi:MAG: sulfatase, partial [Halobacteria archaeon]|nr:sulfatase [Halobacteria archaeon]
DRFFYRDKDWKYINKQGDEELYRLNDDPDEKENIVDSNPPALSEIRSKIEGHREAVAETSMDTDEVEMDEVVQDRLEKLGYKP